MKSSDREPDAVPTESVPTERVPTESVAAEGVAPQPHFLRFDAMRLSDLPLVARLEQLCFTAPWSEGAYRHELTANPRSFYSVLRPPATEEWLPGILAYGGYWLLGVEAHIVTIASHPDFRRRALGEVMLLHLIGGSRYGQVEEVTLEVRPSNRAARSLYAKWGFTEVGLRKRYYRDNNEDALLMTLFAVQSEEVWRPMALRLERLLAGLTAAALQSSS